MHIRSILRTDVPYSELPEGVRRELTALRIDGTQSEQRTIQQDSRRHAIHYLRRLKAIDQGVRHLLDSLNLSPAIRQKIIDYADELEKQCRKLFQTPGWEEKGTAPYQVLLADYVKKISDVLVHQAFIPKDEVMHALGRAEEYANAAEGRASLCTVTQMTDGTWIIQHELPKPPLSPEMKQEFLTIFLKMKENKLNETPIWFQLMSETERELFLHTIQSKIKGEENANIEHIESAFSTIPSKLRSIPGVANFAVHTFIALEDVEIISKRIAERSSMIASRDIRKEVKKHKKEKAHDDEFKTKNVEEIARAKIARHNLQQIIGTTSNQRAKYFIDHFGIPESGHITLVILVQTLVTPQKEPDKSLFNDKQDAVRDLQQNFKEMEFFTSDGQRIEIHFEYISTNHPLNPGRMFQSYGGISSEEKDVSPEEKIEEFSIDHHDHQEMSRLIKIADDFTRQHKSQPETISKLNLIKSGLESAVKRARTVSDRELYISALEELMVNTMSGISYGSCMSGKDRKAIETIYTDAMSFYLDKYPKLPPMSWQSKGETAADRQKFVNIFVSIYMSRHQHENAGQNAHGADGIKTPFLYLPADILLAIKKEEARIGISLESNRYANNNEVEKIKADLVDTVQAKLMGVPSLPSFDQPTSRQRSDTKEANAIKLIFDIVIDPKHNAFWKKQVKHRISFLTRESSAPEGILKMRRLFSTELHANLYDLGQIAVERLGSSYDPQRADTTKEFYKLVQAIARNPDNQQAIEKLNNFKQKMSTSPSPKPANDKVIASSAPTRRRTG